MYGGIGMSASSLHRESTDSLIYLIFTIKICGDTYLSDVRTEWYSGKPACGHGSMFDSNEGCSPACFYYQSVPNT